MLCLYKIFYLQALNSYYIMIIYLRYILYIYEDKSLNDILFNYLVF